MVMVRVWNVALYAAENWTLTKPSKNYLRYYWKHLLVSSLYLWLSPFAFCNSMVLCDIYVCLSDIIWKWLTKWTLSTCWHISMVVDSIYAAVCDLCVGLVSLVWTLGIVDSAW